MEVKRALLLSILFLIQNVNANRILKIIILYQNANFYVSFEIIFLKTLLLAFKAICKHYEIPLLIYVFTAQLIYNILS